MNLRQPGFTYSACGPFGKNEQRIQKFKETWDSQYICQNELDKAYFQDGMTYGDFEDLTRRKPSDKILHDKAFNIAKNSKYDGYQCVLALMVYKFFDEKTSIGVAMVASKSAIKSKNISNKELAEELHKPIIKKSKKRKPFIDNIWAADLADMQLISKFNKGIRFLLCVIDIYSKYAWVIPLIDRQKRNYNY